jgi:hypothetical protein
MKDLIIKLNAEYAAYEAKPTKACSKRIRDLLNEVKKGAPAERARLVEADKAA